MFIENNVFRFKPLPRIPNGTKTDYRTEYSRDYARVLHSPSFRRLQNKTQLFPGQESDFFRNRLTHSLEVSQIAKSIAYKLLKEDPSLPIIPEVCEIAGLIHDIGHPPFGHNGEIALDDRMREKGGFEGNAQTLRVIARLEKKEQPKCIINKQNQDCRIGLNLTARVIASALKYDTMIPVVRHKNDPLLKGYYASESDVVQTVKKCLIENPENYAGKFKTLECSIMDIADDIAYSTYDVEDALKAEFITPYGMIAADKEIFEEICKKLEKDNIKVSVEECRAILFDVFERILKRPLAKQRKLANDENFENKTMINLLDIYRRSQKLSSDGYSRTALTSSLVNSFINGVRVKRDEQNLLLSKVYLNSETVKRVNVLKHFSYVVLINSSRLRVAESRGYEIIDRMFTKLYEGGGYSLLPEDVKHLFNLSKDALWRSRVICDFIAGMTDRYAIEFYGRLFSENPQTIFKPL